MEHRTDQPDQQPSLTPQPNQILATPDTVEQCKAEYDAGADVRAVMAQQERHQR